ncbi:hypothetical protein SLEP1_g3553 [Rubroshorea leprosula]|uniref:Uncharacterized protein n=1 Tax=Rubroshorea leprosula TaxID=152421 RepID=A0AAV5HRI3_9ROSI|nr:hypothetical protein SLEP1_g3553 [Rubroshorea leprosula]
MVQLSLTHETPALEVSTIGREKSNMTKVSKVFLTMYIIK